MTSRFTRIVSPLLMTAVALAAVAAGNSKKSHDAALTRNLTVFNSIVKELENNYVDTIRVEEAFKTTINALLSTVDPYTEYFSSDDRESLEKMTTGEYAGIGSYLMERNGSTYISAPYEGSPAALAGLKPGDKLLRVDTVDVSKLNSAKVSKLLRGQPGTEVAVRVLRPFVSDSVVDVRIVRKKIQTPSMPYYTFIDSTGTGYVRLTSFIDKSPKEVKNALDEFKANPKLRNIVLDLRGNGGGLVESAVEILGFFLPKGTEVLRTRGRESQSEKIYKTTKNPIMPDIPMAVLIDGASASASEITAGAIQDLDRGILVGSRSFGKGLVQGTRVLPYDGLLKVTVAKYYIPSGRLIQALDYSHRNPDGSVARTPDSLTNVYKTRLGREVRDGGGLTPDTTVKWENVSRLLYNIARDNYAFDFATEFSAKNKEIPSPENFTVTDSIYAQFKKSIDPSVFKYDKVGEELIKQLRETLGNEGYMTDEVTESIDSLSKLLIHDLDTDLDRKRPEIAQYLAEEIASRYYFDRGRMAQQIKRDIGLETALKILTDGNEYQKMLSPKKKTASKSTK